MSRTVTIDHSIDIEGTLEAQKISGRIHPSNITYSKAFSVYETTVESDGVKIYLNSGLALGTGWDDVFIQMTSGSLQIRLGAADSWMTITEGFALHGDDVDYFALQATPDGSTTGTATYQLIIGTKA